MSEEDKRKMGIPCEICMEKSAKHVKGGVYNNERKVWIVCDDCVNKVEDNRAR